MRSIATRAALRYHTTTGRRRNTLSGRPTNGENPVRVEGRDRISLALVVAGLACIPAAAIAIALELLEGDEVVQRHLIVREAVPLVEVTQVIREVFAGDPHLEVAA